MRPRRTWFHDWPTRVWELVSREPVPYIRVDLHAFEEGTVSMHAIAEALAARSRPSYIDTAIEWWKAGGDFRPQDDGGAIVLNPASGPFSIAGAIKLTASDRAAMNRMLGGVVIGSRSPAVTGKRPGGGTYAETRATWRIIAPELGIVDFNKVWEEIMCTDTDEDKVLKPAWNWNTYNSSAPKPLYVAVITRGLSVSGGLVPSAGPPSASSGGDWASFVGPDREKVIEKAMEQAQRYSKTSAFSVQYTVLVGTLTDKAEVMKPLYITSPIETPKRALDATDRAHIRGQLRKGLKINAIKYVREITGWGIKDAKDYVDSLASSWQDTRL